MKKFGLLLGSVLLLGLVNGCVEPVGYGGASVGISGEYPSTYVGGAYSYPAYPSYGYHYYRTPYDRDHYWDRGRRWGRHEYRHRDWDDRH
jgi:hypothetical protein